MQYLEFLVTTGLWCLHLLLLVFINFDVARRGTEAKFVATLYIFYTLTLLVPFYHHEHFDYLIDYTPSSWTLFMGVCSDFSLIAAVRYAFKVEKKNIRIATLDSAKLGFKLLLVLAAIGEVLDIGMNRELLLLPKELYIEAVKVPNLILFSIPASLILLGGAIYNPFANRFAKLAVTVLAAIGFTLSVIQGYRGMALMMTLYLVYRKCPRTWPVFPALLITVIGELSNPIKYFVGGMFLDEHFNAGGVIDFYSENVSALLGLSGEQKAIVSNLVLGLRDLSLGQPLLELRNLIPFTNQVFGNITTTSASRLGELTGAGYGQGTGYSYVLFMAESLLLAPIFLFFVTKLIRVLAGTPLTFVSWTIFFSLMRDTPAFWTGELKMLFLLTLVIFSVSYLLHKIVEGGPQRFKLSRAAS
jgi:hypothetical protein